MNPSSQSPASVTSQIPRSVFPPWRSKVSRWWELVRQVNALVREASCRTIGLRHFDVQILGGIALFEGSIAEMETGEGKTLTASLPMYVHALPGRGAHLATVNDYLAERDASLLKNLYELLGLTVGVVLT